MSIRREVIRTICRLGACAHLIAVSVLEAAHPHLTEANPVTMAALPPEHDHTHQDYDRSARLQGVEFTDSGTPTNRPVTQLGIHGVPRAARRW